MKVRCSQCGDYFPKDGMYRTQGMVKVCTPECLAALYRKTPSKRTVSANERRTDGVIPTMTREAVYLRDHHACRYCGRKSTGLHVHHIVYRSQGGRHDETNLITLCSEHHALVHSSKDRYLPLLRAVIWMQYVDRRHLSVPQMERWLRGKPDS